MNIDSFEIAKEKIVDMILGNQDVLDDQIFRLQSYILAITNNCDDIIGKRIKMVYTSDAYTDVVPGDIGTVSHVDDSGTVFVNWEKGSGLGLIPGIDSFEIL